MIFTATTQVPLSALTTLARLKERYACGPCMDLDESQRALLDAFETLYPGEKLRLLHAALNARRVYITGADVLALAPTVRTSAGGEFEPAALSLGEIEMTEKTEDLVARVAALEKVVDEHRAVLLKLLQVPAVRMANLGVDGFAASVLHTIPAQEKNPRGGSENKPHAFDEALRRGDKLREIAQGLHR